MSVVSGATASAGMGRDATWTPPIGPIDLPPLDAGFRVFSLFEFWPPAIFYLPAALQWVWLALRYGSATLPTLANPLMEAGGLCGESKSGIFAQFGAEARRWLAPFVTVTAGLQNELSAIADKIDAEGIGYPLVAKPDIGCRGTGVQVIATPGQLARYLARYPAGESVVLQQLIMEPGEAGIFYVRRPGQTTGHIWSMTLKYFPQVVGDGASTLRTLIGKDRRAGKIAHVYLGPLAHRLDEIPPALEAIPLVFPGNHCRGAIFQDGSTAVTPALSSRFEDIARSIPEFHFGRLDVRFRSLAELQNGKGFHIVEVNGAGSEATHIWDRDADLYLAWRTLLEQFRLLFEIGDRNRARGYRPMSVRELLRMYGRQRRISKQLSRVTQPEPCSGKLLEKSWRLADFLFSA